jgi:demethylmenaquinone methyltransferase/2-methoxy-6-polyprenyl-1,4-benzoquinol methylase
VSRSATPLPAAEDKVAVVRSMFDRIAPRYDLVNRLLTFRMDVGWRRRTVASLGLGPGARVLDLACGTGDLCRDLEKAGHRPLGLDLSLGMLRHARTDAPLAQADALRLPTPDGVADGVTCGFALRNLAALEPFVAECARVLRPGGRLALLEVSAPRNRVLRAGHQMYFGKVVPWVGARLSDAAAYRYLPESVVYLPPPEEVCAMLRAGGFTAVGQRQLSTGIAQLFTATKADGGRAGG